MALDNESFNKQLYDLLKVRGYKPVSKNSKNQDVEASQLADVIEFQFIKDGENYGKAWASVDDAQNVIVYYDEEQADSPEGRTPGKEYDDSWSGFLQHLKSWAHRKQLSFELLNKDRINDDMRQREYLKMKENINEGYYPMGKQASYSDAIPTVKIVIQHTRHIQEGEQRYRNISKIFLENTEGEKILAPTIRPGIAQVYARHLAEGGVPNDERWNHIKSLCEEYNKMAGFVRATRNGQFNESAQQLVNEGISHYNSLRETLGKLRGHRGYNAYFESWTPPLMEEENDDSINELFVQETVDPRIESVMPILSRLSKKSGIKPMTEVSELDEWAQNILEGESKKGIVINGKEVDYASLEIDGVDSSDYPDFSDAYFSAGYFTDGTPMSDEELDQLADTYGELVNSKAFDSLHEGGEDSTTKTLAVPADKMLEAPGAETLAHNQNTEKSNLKAFDLAEEEGRPYICVHAKKGKFECHANSSYEAAKKAAQKWGLKSTAGIDAHLADVKHSPASVGEAHAGKIDKGTIPLDEKENSDTPLVDLEDYKAKKKVLQDLLMDPDASKDPQYKKLIQQRLGRLERQKEQLGVSSPKLDPQDLSGTALNRAEKYADAEMKRKSSFDPDKAFDLAKGGTLGFGALSSLFLDEGMMKHKMHADAEKMSLEQFCDKYGDEDWIKEFWRDSNGGEEVDEGLDANQKRVGQLGPTEKVGPKGAVGKLVGANESVELSEMDKSQPSSDRGGESSGNPYAKGGKATPIKADKAKKDFLGVLQKSVDKHNNAKQDTDKKVAQHMKEGQDDLDAILRLLGK